MTTVAEYFATLGLLPDRASFAVGNRLMAGIREAATSLGGVVAGAFAVDAIVSFTRETIAALPAINDLANQTGFTAEEIQRLGFAASQSGADTEVLNTSLLKFTKNVGEAAKGGKEAQAAFAAVGVSAAGIADRDPRDVLSQVANGLAKIEGPGRRAEVAMALFGLQGAKLVPFLSQGEDAIAALGDRAQDLGLILSGETLSAVDDVDDRINALDATVGGVGRRLVVLALPAIERFIEFAEAASRVLARLPGFLERNGKAIRVLAALVGTLLVGQIVKLIAAQGAAVVAAVLQAAANGPLAGSFGVVVAAVDLASAAMLRFLGRMLAVLAPAAALGLAVALVVLVFDDLITYLRGGESLIGSLIGRFGELRDALFGVVTDPDAHPLVRFFAAIGTGVAAAFAVVDSEFDRFFRWLEAISALGDFIIGLFTDPVETLRAFFRDALAEFSAFVGGAADIASRVAGFLGEARPTGAALQGPLRNLSSSLASVNAGTVASGVLASAPVVRDAVRGGSTTNTVTVAPRVDVVVNATGAVNAAEIGQSVADVGGDAIERAARAAAVDLIPDAG